MATTGKLIEYLDGGKFLCAYVIGGQVDVVTPFNSLTSDVIVVNPAEKPFVLDLVNDIVVSKVE